MQSLYVPLWLSFTFLVLLCIAPLSCDEDSPFCLMVMLWIRFSFFLHKYSYGASSEPFFQRVILLHMRNKVNQAVRQGLICCRPSVAVNLPLWIYLRFNCLATKNVQWWEELRKGNKGQKQPRVTRIMVVSYWWHSRRPSFEQVHLVWQLVKVNMAYTQFWPAICDISKVTWGSVFAGL